MRTLLTIVLVVLCLSAYVHGQCFPGKYWISCLIDTCKLGGKCHADPEASCKMEKTECNGCKPVWHTKTGQKANCSLRRNLKLCPNGDPVVHCKIDSCKWPCSHPDFNAAPCRQSYCGECSAEYLIKDTWVRCPKTTTGATGEMLPIDGVVADNCIKVPCGIDVCVGQRCPAVQRAVCRPDGCNTCTPGWFLDNTPVDCETGAFLSDKAFGGPIVSPAVQQAPWQRTCSPGTPLTPCDYRVCEGKICRNFQNAVCRPDGCGGCVDTWYIDNKLVDCLSDECPPNVPIVKCVDDPCKYFGHYCPAAECRASQCGKCEAKFFSNGVEIDCAMPPKECPAGIEPLTCPWYSCPANICPTNRRLMCRINPCGATCDHEFIDIYTGESRLCRVFDGTERHQVERQQQQQQRQLDALSGPVPAPSLGGLVDPAVTGVKVDIGRVDGGGVIGKADLKQANVGGSGGLIAEPIFINPGPPITDPDLLALLRSFPHEMSVVPSASITSALKKPPPPGALIKSNIASSSVAASEMSSFIPVDSGIPDDLVQAVPMMKPVAPVVPETMDGSSIPDSVLRKLAFGPALSPKPTLTNFDAPVASINPVNSPLKMSPQSGDVLYPELASLSSNTMPNFHGIVQAGKPKFKTGKLFVKAGRPMHHNAPVKQETSVPKPVQSLPLPATGVDAAPKQDVAPKGTGAGKGVPISMQLFSQWAMS